MKKFIKILSLVLALLMISSAFVACDQSKQNDDKQTSAPQGGGAAALPEMNWEGQEYRIFGRDFTENNFKNFEIDRDEMPEDVVGLAVWNRNATLMTKYGIDVVGTLVDVGSGKVSNNAKIFLDAGDDLYDLIICNNDGFQVFATEGQLVNISNLNYINLDHECWNDYANKQLSFGNKLYYTTNKFLLQDKHRTWMVWYNRTLADELNIGHLETEVFNGTWTIDRLIEIAKIGSAETNGEDGMTAGDRWGVGLSDEYCFAQLAYGSGFRISDMGADGYPALVGATEKMVTILDKVFELTTDTESCFFTSIRPTDIDNKEYAETIYREGRAVTMGHCLSYLDNLYKLDFEYGALPTPKYTEDQETYFSIPNIGNGCLLAVPATINSLDFAGFALQAISEESVETSYKEYIQTRCMLQDAYDEDMAKCLRIIFDTVVYDIGFIDNFGGLTKVIWSELPRSSGNTFSRSYGKYEKRAKTEMKKVVEAYASLPY